MSDHLYSHIEGVRTAKDVEATAIHEAGHAVASVVLGLGLQAVTINPPEEKRSDGKITCGLTVSIPLSSVPLDKRFILSACGMLAEMKDKTKTATFIWFPGIKEILGRADDDLDEMETLATQLKGDKPDPNEIFQAACRLVEDNWDAIVVVFYRLLQFTTLSGEDVRAIVDLMRSL